MRVLFISLASACASNFGRGADPLADIDIAGTSLRLEALYDMALDGTDFVFNSETNAVKSLANDEDVESVTEDVVSEESQPTAQPVPEPQPFEPVPVVSQAEPASDELQFDAAASSFREYMFIMSRNTARDYERCVLRLKNKIRARARLPLYPVDDYIGSLDPTVDIANFPKMMKMITPFHLAFFTEPSQRAAFEELFRKCRAMNAVKAIDVPSIEGLLSDFFESAKRFVENYREEPRESKYSELMNAALPLFNVEVQVFKSHSRSMTYSICQAKGIQEAAEPGILDNRILSFAMAFARFKRKNDDSINIPELVDAVDKLVKLNFQVSNAVGLIEREDNVERVRGMLKSASAGFDDMLQAVYELVRVIMKIEEGLNLFDDVMTQMVKLTPRDFKDYMRYFTIQLMKTVGLPDTYEDRGRCVQRVLHFGPIMHRIASIRHLVFEGNPDLLTAFDRAYEDLTIAVRDARLFKERPMKESVEFVKSSMNKYLISLFKLTQGWSRRERRRKRHLEEEPASVEDRPTRRPRKPQSKVSE